MVTILLTVFLLLIIGFSNSFSQNLDFDAYKKFLDEHKNLTTQGLFDLYPPGLFKSQSGINPQDALFYSNVNNSYKLTQYEKKLLSKNGFMVTERQSFNSFWEAFADVFHKDLPVFISTDAILHSIHMSYDAILKDLELSVIIDKLSGILNKMHSYSSYLNSKYSSNPIMEKMLLEIGRASCRERV